MALESAGGEPESQKRKRALEPYFWKIIFIENFWTDSDTENQTTSSWFSLYVRRAVEVICI